MELSYKVKPMQVGTFTVPATLLEDMYDLRYKATSDEGKVTVTE
jgi:uncharacterized protein YfaS (alpha-2-macroglobulin family)